MPPPMCAPSTWMLPLTLLSLPATSAPLASAAVHRFHRRHRAAALDIDAAVHRLGAFGVRARANMNTAVHSGQLAGGGVVRNADAAVDLVDVQVAVVGEGGRGHQDGDGKDERKTNHGDLQRLV